MCGATSGDRNVSTVPVVLGRLSEADAGRRLAVAATAEPTYAGPVGRTLAGTPPLHGFVMERPVGRGDDAFVAAREALRTLAPQRAVARVHPDGATATLGDDVVVAVSMGPVTVVATNRIVALIDKPRRFGFAYGTLPGHPEDGEEGFEVRQGPDGVVNARVVVDAVAALPMGRLVAGPVRLVSRRYGHRYLAAIAAAVAAGVSSGA
jgi:uncharacterized protein (UPF0548 family)